MWLYGGVCGRPRGFYLLDHASGEELAFAGPDDRAIDLNGLGLADGVKRLELLAVDEYGSESERVLVDVEILAGVVRTELASPVSLSLVVLDGGLVLAEARVGQSNALFQLVTPAAWEFVDEAGLVLETVPWAGGGVAVELGPFGDGETVRLGVRTSDGEVGGSRSRVVWGGPVVARATGPKAPVLLEEEPHACF